MMLIAGLPSGSSVKLSSDILFVLYRIAGFKRHFSIPDDIHLSIVADSTLDMEREDETTIVFPILSIVKALNRCLRINLGIPAIRHCYALAKSSGRHGRFFLRAKDVDHQRITMLSSSGKRVDDVMVVVQGRNLKKVLSSTDGAILSDIEAALKYFGRRSLQKQGRAAHILLHYEPTYTTFSAAENIPVPEGEDSLIAFILSDFKNLRQVGFEGSDSERGVANVTKSDQFEIESDAVLNSADPPSALGQGDLSLDGVFHGLEDIPAANLEDMAGLSLSKLARKVNAERLATWRRAEALPSEAPPVTTSQFSLPASESESFRVIEVETVENRDAESTLIVQACQEVEAEKRTAEFEAGVEEHGGKRPRLEGSDVIVPFVIQPMIKNMPISSNASALKDPEVAFSLATSVSLPSDKEAFRVETDLDATALAAQSALLTVGWIADMVRRHRDAVKQIGHLCKEVEGQRRRAEVKALRADKEASRADAEMEKACCADQLRSDAERKADAREDALKLAQKAISKLEAELAEMKMAKESAESESSKVFEAGKNAGLAEYVDQVPKFENRGFKHGWHKALAAANASLIVPIPYQQVDVEPLESNSDG
ncbi:hypothetical protein HYC85_027965 [Camellia sinensis]|uniref:Uncharacterized protein n=1 Tax=Camellia sinensis TaxID=4442 RepID=A0A7J7FXV2_CAMSI|nr:hypothetical protein HYC85_027965 [Camellia sinensis]